MRTKIFILIFVLYFGVAFSQSTRELYIYIPNSFVEIVRDSCKKLLPAGYEINPVKNANNKWYIPYAVLDTVRHYGFSPAKNLLNKLTVVELENSTFGQTP